MGLNTNSGKKICWYLWPWFITFCSWCHNENFVRELQMHKCDENVLSSSSSAIQFLSKHSPMIFHESDFANLNWLDFSTYGHGLLLMMMLYCCCWRELYSQLQRSLRRGAAVNSISSQLKIYGAVTSITKRGFYLQ